ncbi:ABC transporter ATP-binding protein [Cutibacterium acnes]
MVQRASGTIPADRTAVIITHRLSTVEIADWVLVLEHSQILENGSPAELEAQGGRYVGLHKPGRSHLPDGDVSEAHPESRRRD